MTENSVSSLIKYLRSNSDQRTTYLFQVSEPGGVTNLSSYQAQNWGQHLGTHTGSRQTKKSISQSAARNFLPWHETDVHMKCIVHIDILRLPPLLLTALEFWITAQQVAHLLGRTMLLERTKSPLDQRCHDHLQ